MLVNSKYYYEWNIVMGLSPDVLPAIHCLHIANSVQPMLEYLDQPLRSDESVFTQLDPRSTQLSPNCCAYEDLSSLIR